MEIKPYSSNVLPTQPMVTSNVMANPPMIPAHITTTPSNLLPAQTMPVSNMMPMMAPQPMTMGCHQIYPQHMGCDCYYDPCYMPCFDHCHMPVYDHCCFPGMSPYSHFPMHYPCY